MLRFNIARNIVDKITNKISIHLMLRFNFNALFFIHYLFCISIHLMLRFNIAIACESYRKEQFQYILCCGSTYFYILQPKRQKGFQYILCCGSTLLWLLLYILNTYISIHLMLRFNEGETLISALELVFQYILCCGSTNFSKFKNSNKIISIHLMLRFNV